MELLQPLLQAGPIGAVVIWLMYRVEKRLDSMTAAINRLAMAHALEVATRPETPEAVKLQAKAILEEIKHSQRGKNGNGGEGSFLP